MRRTRTNSRGRLRQIPRCHAPAASSRGSIDQPRAIPAEASGAQVRRSNGSARIAAGEGFAVGSSTSRVQEPATAVYRPERSAAAWTCATTRQETISLARPARLSSPGAPASPTDGIHLDLPRAQRNHARRASRRLKHRDAGYGCIDPAGARTHRTHNSSRAEFSATPAAEGATNGNGGTASWLRPGRRGAA